LSLQTRTIWGTNPAAMKNPATSPIASASETILGGAPWVPSKNVGSYRNEGTRNPLLRNRPSAGFGETDGRFQRRRRAGGPENAPNAGDRPPLMVLVAEDSEGKTTVSYTNPSHLKERLGLRPVKVTLAGV